MDLSFFGMETNALLVNKRRIHIKGMAQIIIVEFDRSNCKTHRPYYRLFSLQTSDDL